MSIKVLHLIDSAGLYGAEKMLLTLVAEQRKRGLSPLILSAGAPEMGEKAIESEAKRLGLPVLPWRMKPGLNLKQSLEVCHWARQGGFQILHSHGYKFNILLGILPRFVRDVPLITTLHGYVNAPRWSKMWLYEKLDQRLLPRMDKVCVVSAHMEEQPALSRVVPEKLVVVENGLGTEANLLSPPARLPATSSECFKILAVGRLSREKNFAALITALANDNLRKKNMELFIVGEGPLLPELEQLSRKYGISKKVHFLGYRKDVTTLMREASLLAMPSLTEGLPVTLLEAMRCQLPVVASSVGGIPKALEHGKAGILIKPGSPQSLTNTLERIVSGEINLGSLAQRARERFEQHYSAESMESQYMGLYECLIKSDSTRQRIGESES